MASCAALLHDEERAVAILSFQSRVVCGGVGHAGAEFALRRLGWDVWPIDTVVLSNHPGHGAWRGGIRPADELARLVDGLSALGVLTDCRAVLSGYLGSADNGLVVLDAVSRVRRARSDAPWCCDPVMGDRETGLYVAQSVADFLRTHAFAADILTPNHFELEILAGRRLPTLASVLAAAAELRGRGPRLLLVSSVQATDLPPEGIGTVLTTDDGGWIAETPRLALAAKGAGDLLAALFLARWLECGDAPTALGLAVAATWAVVRHTAADPQAHDLALVAAQRWLERPPDEPVVRRLA